MTDKKEPEYGYWCPRCGEKKHVNEMAPMDGCPPDNSSHAWQRFGHLPRTNHVPKEKN